MRRPLAQIEVTVEDLQDLVGTLEGATGWGPSEWVALGAALASALFAFLLWRVTSKYTGETETIAQANYRMAIANDRMVDLTASLEEQNRSIVDATNRSMLANEQLLDEMKEDRRISRRRRSEDAARNLQRALVQAELLWRRGEGDEADFRDAFTHWDAAMATDRNVIVDPNTREDVRRFYEIMWNSSMLWNLILVEVGREFGQEELARREESATTEREYRLNVAARKLRNVLSAHQRDEDLGAPQMPDDALHFGAIPHDEFINLYHAD